MMSIQDMVPILIGMIIMFGVSIIILDTIAQAFTCESMSGYVSGGATDALKYPSGTFAGLCHANNSNSIDSFELVILSVVIVAAAIIMYAINYLRGNQ